MGAVAGAGGLSDGSPVRIRPPACCAAHHHCSQRRSARRSSWLIVAAATVATAWSWPSIAAHPRRPPDPPTRRRSPLLRPGVVASSCSSAADQPPDVQLRWRAVASPDRVASAALDRPAARRRDVLAWAGGEARSQAADGADGRRHGPRGHDCGGSSAALHVGGAAGGSCGGGDGRIRSAGDGARLAVAACCASAEFHDRAASCASPILRGWP